MINIKEIKNNEDSNIIRKSKIYLIPIIFIVVGLIFMFFVIKNIYNTFIYSEKTIGHCFNYSSEYDSLGEQTYYDTYYHYQVNGKEYTAISKKQQLKPQIKDIKTIYYQKDNPENFFIINTYEFILNIIASLFCIAAGIIIYCSLNRNLKIYVKNNKKY